MVAGTLFFGLELEGPARGSLDFAHPAHSIATPMVTVTNNWVDLLPVQFSLVGVAL